MVKARKAVSKKEKSEVVTDEPKVEDSTENQVEDDTTPNEDTSNKKKGKTKKETCPAREALPVVTLPPAALEVFKTRKPHHLAKAKIPSESPSQEEEAQDDEETEAKENGDVPSEKKKPATVKKPKATKRAAPKPTVEPARKSSRTPKPVAKENGEEDSYEVEKLIKSRQVRGKTQYLVRWKGFSSKDDTWEDETDLNCPELLQKFKEDNPNTQNTKKRSSSKSPVKPVKKTKTKSTEKDYEVEEVVGIRVKNGKKEFKIRWKGYKPSDDTWEPEKYLSCQDLIKAYLEEHKDEVENVTKKSPAKKAKSPAKSAKSKRARRK